MALHYSSPPTFSPGEPRASQELSATTLSNVRANDPVFNPFYERNRLAMGLGVMEERSQLASTPRPQTMREMAESTVAMNEMMDIAFYFELKCSPFSTIVTNICTYTFRNGLEWRPKFHSKCILCGAEYQTDVDECQCGSKEFREPDIHQQSYFSGSDGVSFLERANDWGMSFLEVLKVAERHRTVADNQVIIMQKSYLIGDDGEVLTHVIQQIVPIDPRDMEKLLSPTGAPGNGTRICLVHREATNASECRICGAKTHEARYKTRNGQTHYYTDEEVIWTSEYSPSLIYGYPEILRCADIAEAIVNMDWRLLDYYKNGSLPSLVGVNSPSQESLAANVRKLVEQKAETPSMPVFISMGESGRMSMLKLMDNPTPEMWEIRRRAVLDIAAKFNFPAALLNDLTDAGGLNIETEQYSEWGDQIERIRNDLEASVISRVIANIPSITDWELGIKTEADDETMDEMEVLHKQAQILDMFDKIGFEVGFRDNKITISDSIVKAPRPSEFMESFRSMGDMHARRPPTIPQVPEEMDDSDFLSTLYDRQFLSERYDVLLPILMAEEAIADIIKVLSPDEVPELYSIIIEAMSSPEGWTLQEIVNFIVVAFGLDMDTATLLARTESNRVATLAREVYAKENDPPDALYTGDGSDDRRTSELCKAIKAEVERRGGGVRLEELKAIVRAESRRYMKREPPTDWTPHPNCRHTFRRVWL